VKGIFIATGIAALSATGVGLIFLAVGGTAAYHFLSANMDAELPIYSIAVYSAEDIVGMCDYLM